MVDFVKNGPNGFGRCTSITCLMQSSFEAAKAFILQKQTMPQGPSGPGGSSGPGGMGGNSQCEDKCYELI
jgi:hypothetical protein